MTTDKKSNEKNMLVEEIAWLLDSGCSDHIVNSDKYFSTSVKLKTPVDIKVDDGFSLKSDKIGNITTFSNVVDKQIETEIKDVYYVPEMKQNLLSILTIVDQKKTIMKKFLIIEKN